MSSIEIEKRLAELEKEGGVSFKLRNKFGNTIRQKKIEEAVYATKENMFAEEKELAEKISDSNKDDPEIDDLVNRMRVTADGDLDDLYARMGSSGNPVGRDCVFRSGTELKRDSFRSF